MSGRFDGVDDWVDLVGVAGTSNLVRNVSTFSWMAWIQLQAWAGVTQQIFYVEVAPAVPGSNSRLEVQIAGATQFLQTIVRMPDAGVMVNLSSALTPIPLDAGQAAPRTHVAITVDGPGQTIRFYLNGVLTETFAALVNLVAPTDNTASGRASHMSDAIVPAQFFSGAVSDLRLYADTLLTDAQIQTIYRMNGQDGFVGNVPLSLAHRYTYTEATRGTVLTVAALTDKSPLQQVSAPFGITSAPTYEVNQHQFRRRVA
jgi:hypothetical protein